MKKFDAVIIGAGIAGLSAADAILQKDKNCAVIDSQEPGAGASGSPGLLINPATGRRAKKSMNAEKSLETAEELIERVQGFCKVSFYEKNGVVRPALTPEIGVDFRRSTEKYKWPNGWIEWFDETAFKEKFPVFKNQFGGLFINRAITLEGGLYMKYLSDYLLHSGVRQFYRTKASYEKNEDGWIVSLSDGEILRTKHLICASGAMLTEEKNWSFLNLHPVKGQTVTFYFDRNLPLNYSVSSLGYMAYMNQAPNKLVVGSTYEHHYNHTGTDKQGLIKLREKLENNFPGWGDYITKTEQWAGIRVTSRDKKPVIGEHPEHRGLYIFGALGSKGMILGRYTAGQLVDYIFDKKPVDPIISVNRFF